MKPEHTHGTRSPLTDTTDPGGPRTPDAAARRDRTPVDRPVEGGVAAHEASTSPDPLDVVRLILSLERPPRPPAPIPDERASSDGGRFVAYGATGRPAQAQTEQGVRRQALAEMSVLVNATPVPADAGSQDASTARTSPQARRRPRAAGSSGGRGAVRAWALWTGTALVVALGLLGSVVVVSRLHESQAPATPGARTAAAPLVTPASATSPRVVLATPEPEKPQGMTPPAGTASDTASIPAAPVASVSSVTSVPATPAASGHPLAVAIRPAVGPSEPPRPTKPAFEHW
jgi:hypothetical protein